jgi:hypothetical protein
VAQFGPKGADFKAETTLNYGKFSINCQSHICAKQAQDTHIYPQNYQPLGLVILIGNTMSSTLCWTRTMS